MEERNEDDDDGAVGIRRALGRLWAVQLTLAKCLGVSCVACVG
jgi:hypothetical protein